MRSPAPAPAGGAPRFCVRACTAEHIGDRAEQQDRVALIDSPRNPGALLAVLADGVGGRSGGRMASDQVVATATHLFRELSEHDAASLQLLETLASEAHTVIRLTALSAEKEPHSTLVALLLRREHAAWAHVGDSRLYLFRDGKLRHCTEDHSVAQHADGRAGRQPTPPPRRMLLSALGLSATPRLTLCQTRDLQPGDAFLLCSDGLWSYLSAEQMGAIVHAHPPREAAARLLQTARDRALGRGDNLSLAIVRLDPSDDGAPRARSS